MFLDETKGNIRNEHSFKGVCALLLCERKLKKSFADDLRGLNIREVKKLVYNIVQCSIRFVQYLRISLRSGRNTF